MEPEWKVKLLQLAVKMQQDLQELYILMNENPELHDGVNRDKLGDADYRLSLLTTHLVDLAAK